MHGAWDTATEALREQVVRSRAADPLYYLWNPSASRRSWRRRVHAATYGSLFAANPGVAPSGWRPQR